MVALQKTPTISHMTVAEFLVWPGDPSERTWQLIDGEPVAMAPASDAHGSIQAAAAAMLFNHLRAQGSPCRVVTPPGITPRVRADNNVRVPDLAVTCAPHDLREHLLRDPVLVIEILSPSNERETWANVWAYATIPSVQEILVIRSVEIGAELLRRGADGVWPERPATFGPEGELELRSVGGVFRVIDFYVTTALARR